MRRGNSCRKYTNDTIGLQKCSNKEQKKKKSKTFDFLMVDLEKKITVYVRIRRGKKRYNNI